MNQINDTPPEVIYLQWADHDTEDMTAFRGREKTMDLKELIREMTNGSLR